MDDDSDFVFYRDLKQGDVFEDAKASRFIVTDEPRIAVCIGPGPDTLEPAMGKTVRFDGVHRVLKIEDWNPNTGG